MSSIIDMMIQAALKDEWPTDPECLHTFMFDRCTSEEELINLFGVYIGLIKLNNNFEKSEFKKAVQENRLATYIIEVHEGMDSYYLKWFKDNISRFS